MSKQVKTIIVGLVVFLVVIVIGICAVHNFHEKEQKLQQIATKVIEEKEESVDKKVEPKEDIKQEQPKQDERKKVEPKEQEKKVEPVKDNNPSKEVKKNSSKEVKKAINKRQAIIDEVNNPKGDINCAIDIPSIGLNILPVREGNGDLKENLTKGGSLLPKLPEPPEPGSNAVICAYRNVEGHDYLKNIDSIKPGDEMTLYVYDDTYKYKCKEKFIVNENEYNKISEDLGYTAITLFSIDATGGQRHVVRFKAD